MNIKHEPTIYKHMYSYTIRKRIWCSTNICVGIKHMRHKTTHSQPKQKQKNSRHRLFFLILLVEV